MNDSRLYIGCFNILAAVFCYGTFQHVDGVSDVMAVINLAFAGFNAAGAALNFARWMKA